MLTFDAVFMNLDRIKITTERGFLLGWLTRRYHSEPWDFEPRTQAIISFAHMIQIAERMKTA